MNHLLIYNARLYLTTCVTEVMLAFIAIFCYFFVTFFVQFIFCETVFTVQLKMTRNDLSGSDVC